MGGGCNCVCVRVCITVFIYFLQPFLATKFCSTLLHLRPSDSTVSEDAGIEPKTVAIFGIGSQTLDLIRRRLDLVKTVDERVS
jgi:hypothetical protein